MPENNCDAVGYSTLQVRLTVTGGEVIHSQTYPSNEGTSAYSEWMAWSYGAKA
jgi:hypothetical protein